MEDVTRVRREAWSGLVDEVTARPATVDDLAGVIRKNPSLLRRTREARASAGMARQALGRVTLALENRPIADPVQAQLVLAWTSCVNDILALTERLCSGLLEPKAA